jgi:hypothetical protein
MKPQQRNIYHSNDRVSPAKQKRLSDNINPDDLSDDLESVSQMLSERSAKNKNARINNMKNNKNSINTKPLSTVDETKKKLEKQFDNSNKKGYKPSPNAVPVMNFADSKLKNKNQVI